MSKWKEYRLDQIGQVVGGGTPSSIVKTYWEGDVGWITPADLSGYQFKHIGNGSRNITKLGLKKSSAKLHPKNTVLMTSRAPIGYLAIADKSLATNQGFQSIRCNEDIADFNFIYYLLSVYKDGIALIASGATFPEVSNGKVRQYKIKLPPLPTQKKIAKILSNYDNLIENNLKRIKLLEESARLTYEMSLKDYYSWKEFKLADISDYLGRGVTPKYMENSGFLAINQKANKGNFLDIINFKEYELGNWVPEEKYAQNGDILINSLGEGTIGRVHFYNWNDNKYPVDQHMSIFRAQKNISIYIFHLLSSELGQAILHTIKTGGTNMTMLNINDLRNIKVRVPSQHEYNKVSKAMIEMYDLKSKLEFQNQLLKESRDILLPRLMTGTIETDDIDIAV